MSPFNSKSTRKKNELPNTALFIDYEYWYWTLYNLGGQTPDVAASLQEVKSRGKLLDIYVFGDFTSDLMKKEIPKLRSITNNIIDCSSIGTNRKDYTDTIMLDHLYQHCMKREEIDQYILFTGDGHFHSVAAFLVNFLDKTVGIMGIERSFSAILKSTASWIYELPAPPVDEVLLTSHWPGLLAHIHWAESKNMMPTFSGTTTNMEKHSGIPLPELQASLRALIDAGFISQEYMEAPDQRNVRVMITDWNLVESEGLYSRTEYAN